MGKLHADVLCATVRGPETSVHCLTLKVKSFGYGGRNFIFTKEEMASKIKKERKLNKNKKQRKIN